MAEECAQDTGPTSEGAVTPTKPPPREDKSANATGPAHPPPAEDGSIDAPKPSAPPRRRRPNRGVDDAPSGKRPNTAAGAQRRAPPGSSRPAESIGTIHVLVQEQMARCPPERPRSSIDLNVAELRYLAQNEELRNRVMAGIHAMSREESTDDVPRRLKVAMSSLPNKASIFRRLEAHESTKFDAWVDAALEIPIGIYTPPPLSGVTNSASIRQLLERTRAAMDEELFGQHAAKDEVVRLVCQWACSGALNPFAIGLQGPPGIGKTTFAKRVLAKAIGRPFAMVGIGGASDSSFLTGHSYTYEGAICGRIADALREAKCMDPIICIDEIDKISRTSKGDDIVNTLIHLTDREQNMHFRDRYFHGIDMDVSRVIFAFSFNDVGAISPILLDRLNVITMQPPTVDEKVQIARRHLIPRTLACSSLSASELTYTDECIRAIIAEYTDEAGVRDLERMLLRVTSTLNVLIRGGGGCLPMLKCDLVPGTSPIVCDVALLRQLVVRVPERESVCRTMYM